MRQTTYENIRGNTIKLLQRCGKGCGKMSTFRWDNSKLGKLGSWEAEQKSNYINNHSLNQNWKVIESYGIDIDKLIW